MPHSNIAISFNHLHLNGMWIGVDLRMETKMTRVLRDWTVCSKYGNCFRFNNHDWRDLFDHLMSTRILTLRMNTIF